MKAYKGDGHKLAILIIDEQSDLAPYYKTTAQREILEAAKVLNMPIWRIELNPNYSPGSGTPNRPTIPALAYYTDNILTKPGPNAFAPNTSLNLHAALSREEITMLVVMGYSRNMCVRASATGDWKSRVASTFIPGATQFGYIVLTSNAILRGGSAAGESGATLTGWELAPGVRFYTEL